MAFQVQKGTLPSVAGDKPCSLSHVIFAGLELRLCSVNSCSQHPQTSSGRMQAWWDWQGGELHWAPLQEHQSSGSPPHLTCWP